jgi:hypothetical protein
MGSVAHTLRRGARVAPSGLACISYGATRAANFTTYTELAAEVSFCRLEGGL